MHRRDIEGGGMKRGTNWGLLAALAINFAVWALCLSITQCILDRGQR